MGTRNFREELVFVVKVKKNPLHFWFSTLLQFLYTKWRYNHQSVLELIENLPNSSVVHTFLDGEYRSVFYSGYSIDSKSQMFSVLKFKQQNHNKVFNFVIVFSSCFLFFIFIQEVNILYLFVNIFVIKVLIFIIIYFLRAIYQEKGLLKVYEICIFNYLLVIGDSI